MARDGAIILDVTQNVLEPIGVVPYFYLQADDAVNSVMMRVIAVRYYAAPAP